MRALILLPIAVLAACAEDSAPEHNAFADTIRNRIECRFPGNTQFERSCTFERDPTDMAVLLIRKPDGGFRRVRVVADGRGVVAADGAEAARVTILADNQIEVAIGGDQFRLPATVRGR